MVKIWRIFNKNEFKDELNRCCWDDVTSPNLNTDISVCNFYNKVEKLLEEMVPIKKHDAERNWPAGTTVD